MDTGVELIKYIDDCNGIEKMREGITTMSCRRQKRKNHAAQSEGVFRRVRDKAATLGMRVNS